MARAAADCSRTKAAGFLRRIVRNHRLKSGHYIVHDSPSFRAILRFLYIASAEGQTVSLGPSKFFLAPEPSRKAGLLPGA